MSKIRMKAKDAAFQFRMGAGFPGDVNRTHPVSIEPALPNASTPPTLYGEAVLVDTATNSVRPFAAGDTGVTAAYGITVRPYPFQQSSASNYGAAALGSAAPPTTGAIDIMRSGYMTVQIPAGVAVTKGGAVYVWCAASSGAHVQGGFEGAASGGNTAALAGCTFNGPADASGVVEIAFNI